MIFTEACEVTEATIKMFYKCKNFCNALEMNGT